MNHLRQTRPFNCGQTCLAIVTDKEIGVIEKLMNKKGCTRTKELIKVLKASGYTTETDRLVKWKDHDLFPELAIAKMKRPESSHWIILKKAKGISDINRSGHWVYDPSINHRMRFGSHSDAIKEYGFRIISILKIKKG